MFGTWIIQKMLLLYGTSQLISVYICGWLKEYHTSVTRCLQRIIRIIRIIFSREEIVVVIVIVIVCKALRKHG